MWATCPIYIIVRCFQRGSGVGVATMVATPPSLHTRLTSHADLVVHRIRLIHCTLHNCTTHIYHCKLNISHSVTTAHCTTNTLPGHCRLHTTLRIDTVLNFFCHLMELPEKNAALIWTPAIKGGRGVPKQTRSCRTLFWTMSKLKLHFFLGSFLILTPILKAGNGEEGGTI